MTPATHNRGSKTIDAIYTSASLLDIENAGWLSFDEGIGDHRIAYADIQLEHLINKDKYDIITSTARQLQIKNEDAVQKYVHTCERDFLKHGIVKKTDQYQNKTGRW